jgi:hypothetical protein
MEIVSTLLILFVGFLFAGIMLDATRSKNSD